MTRRLPFSTVGTWVLTRGHHIPTVAFSTLPPGLAPAHKGALTRGSLRPTMGSPIAQRATALPPRAQPLAPPSQDWTAPSGPSPPPPRDPRSLAARRAGYLTPRGFRDRSGESPLSPAQTHTRPPRPPPPELPFESREPSHRAAGSSLASGTEPGSGSGFPG